MIESCKIGYVAMPTMTMGEVEDTRYKAVWDNCHTVLDKHVAKWLWDNDVKFSLPLLILDNRKPRNTTKPIIEFDDFADEVHFRLVWL